MSSSLAISIFQLDLSWENKESNKKNIELKLEHLPTDTRLVILPEMFTTGFSMQAAQLAEEMCGETVQWLKQMAVKYNIVICGSIMIKENEKYYNRFIWVLPDGKLGFYDKRHLFSYAEENLHFSSGNKRLITQINGCKFNVQICYDLRFPVWSRLQHESEFDVLIYVANWPQKRRHAWLTLLQARAIENQCYVIGCNRVGIDGKQNIYSGDSCVINPLGEIITPLSDSEKIIHTKLDLDLLQNIRSQFPFLRDRDNFTIT